MDLPTNLRLIARLTRDPFDTNEKGCHLWRHAHLPKGYGLVRFEGRLLLTHRAAYMAWNGPIPAGMQVRHSCDTPPCFNPDHLLLGTMKQNNQDMHDRGRVVRDGSRWKLVG